MKSLCTCYTVMEACEMFLDYNDPSHISRQLLQWREHGIRETHTFTVEKRTHEQPATTVRILCRIR